MPAKGVAKLKKEADKYFSIFIRLRDADSNGICRCITCPKTGHWKTFHAGHFVKRSVSKLRYSPKNVNAQCAQCNVYMYGQQYEYARALDLKYGEGTAARLHSQRFTTHKWKPDELISIIEEAKKGIAQYETQTSALTPTE